MRRHVFFMLIAAIIALGWPADADAQHARTRAPRRSAVVFVGGYYYDPFFGPYPWWPPIAYPYPYFPVYDDRAEVRVLVTPKEAAVYVDGYYAGIVDDFDGFFQRLPLTAGAHEIVLYLDGYRTARQRLYLGPRSTYSLRSAMERLAPGERSEPPTLAPPVPPPPAGTAMTPRTPPRYAPPVSTAAASGTLAIQVQPADATVFIDGQCWVGSEIGEPLTVDVGAGTHRVEVVKPRYTSFVQDVTVRPGETTSLNVSLTPAPGGR